jgi:hypothetical protein
MVVERGVGFFRTKMASSVVSEAKKVLTKITEMWDE